MPQETVMTGVQDQCASIVIDDLDIAAEEVMQTKISSVVDPFHFDMDPDPVPVITDPDPGRIFTKIQSFEIS